LSNRETNDVLEAESDSLRKQLFDSREKLVEARGRLQNIVTQTTDRQIRLSAIKEELKAWMDRISQAEVRMSDLNIRQDAEINELERLKNRPDEAQMQMTRLSETKSAAEEARKNAADKLAVAETGLAEVEKQSRDADKKLGLEREERVRCEAVVEQVALYQSELAERIKEKLQCLPEEILDKAGLDINDTGPEIDETEARIERLARERERIGPVNLRAEIEVEELEQKISDMETERDDLNGAIDRLRRAISSLNKEGRSRLLQAFEDVNSHFQKLFTRLFGGGSAHLKLIEAEDPLDAGIEIMASPPGKKLQTMSLLSGGEQALTALALIFSAFLTNPAPICVLDEVDAPLDDSNVDRFCSTLRELSNITNTRFLIITHHRLTMARMDRLFGVTMAEQGVSQLVSVNLEGAEKLRETA
jgi:chromosome segregation protein